MVSAAAPAEDPNRLRGCCPPRNPCTSAHRLAVKSEVEPGLLGFLVDAQTDRKIDQLQDHESRDGTPGDRRGNSDELNPELLDVALDQAKGKARIALQCGGIAAF